MTQINNINGSPVLQTGQRTGAASAGGFQDTLENALGKTSEESSGSDPLAALGEPQALNFSQDILPASGDISGKTDSLLDLLASYATSLEDPDASLKDLSAMVEQIQAEAQELMASADESTTAGSQLKEIAAQTALTANMEYIKFQRGDYLE